MQSSQTPPGMEGPNGAAGDPAHHSVPPQAYPPAPNQAATAAAALTVNEREWGRNKQFTGDSAKRAMLDLVQRLAEKDNQTLADLFNFMKTADVVFFDPQGREVQIGRVVVTWED